MNYIHDPSKFPQKEHFAAIVFETVRESGYDRDDTGSIYRIQRQRRIDKVGY